MAISKREDDDKPMDKPVPPSPTSPAPVMPAVGSDEDKATIRAESMNKHELRAAVLGDDKALSEAARKELAVRGIRPE